MACVKETANSKEEGFLVLDNEREAVADEEKGQQIFIYDWQ